MSAPDSRRGRHTRIIEGAARAYVDGVATHHPAIMPTVGHVIRGVFYGKAKSPAQWHVVRMPVSVLRNVL